jgi:hypothetical protein
MSACANGGRPFDKLTMDERIAIEKKVIKATRKRTEMGFAVTVDENKYNETIKGVSGLPSAYSFCLMQCFFIVRRWIERNNYQGDVAYFFEAGHESQGEADRFMRDEVLSSPEKRARYRYISHTFADKRVAIPLVSGDTLAWQWYHYHARRPRPARRDLMALLRPKDMVMDFSEANLDELRAALLIRGRSVADASAGQFS